nr:cysteine-rich KTR domain-containing protein [Sporosalibacterium faouarense]
MIKEEYLLCPMCQSKTMLQIREDTELKNFPLFCPKSKQDMLISVKYKITTVIKEPDARRRADNQRK